MNETMTSADGWQLDGAGAEAYERYLVPAFSAHWADRLLALVDPRPRERVLDVGCGTGIVARRAAARVGPGGAVTGIDVNPGMLAVARERASGVQPAIQWWSGDAARLPFPDASFDVVVSQLAIQFVADRAAALREMRRVLAAGGRLGLVACRPIAHSTVYASVADALQRHAGEAAGEMMRSPFPAWTREDLRSELEKAGLAGARVLFDVATVRYPSPGELLRREASASPLAEAIRALPADRREALVAEIEEVLADHVDDEGLVFPMESFLVVAVV